MQVNTITIEADQYRDLVSENAILWERMNRLYNYIEFEEIEATKKERSLYLNEERILEIVCYHRTIETDKRIRKIKDQMVINAAEEVSRNVDLV